MTILFAPFAARHPTLNGSGSPKDYPFAKELAELIIAQRHNLIQVGGEVDEPLVEDFRKNLSFDEVSQLISTSDTGVCVDSYLQHHFWYLNKPAIVLWGISDPDLSGIHFTNPSKTAVSQTNQFDFIIKRT
jgi:ADP-heptose:LPS heptosyltransferase